MLFCEILLLVVMCLCLRVAWAYIMLIVAKCRTDKSFDVLFGGLKKHISNTKEFLYSLNNSENIDVKLVNETIGFISKLTDFSVEKDGNERIAGYANAITINLEKIFASLEENSCSCDLYQKYKASEQSFNKIKTDYNSKALKLKHYVDVFPSSLIARFKKINTMDNIL